MKVLRTTATFYPHVTGPAYQAYKISEGLEERGHESPLVTTDVIPENEEPGYPPEMEEDDEFPFRIIRRKPLFSIDQYRCPPHAIFDLFSESPDIIHSHGYQNAIKDVFYLGNFIQSKPFVIHGHGSFSKDNDPTISRTHQFKLYNKIWFRTVKRADAVVVSSEQERRDAISFGVNEEKLWTIPVGKEQSVYTSIPRDPPEDHLRVLFVGRLAPRRNIEFLLEEIARMKRDDIRLRIVGGEGTLSNSSKGDYEKKLMNQVQKLGIENYVEFTGPKYGDDLIEEYRGAHLFVNPTHYENFGQANLEAAFAGLPLVATPTGVALDIVTDSETGYFIEDSTDLVNILSEISPNSPQLYQMSQNISTHAVNHYTWDSILDQYQTLYKKLL